MKLVALTLICLGLAVPIPATAQTGGSPGRTDMGAALDDIRAVSPALERFTREDIQGEVWKRPGLSPRDRSIVTLATLIARNGMAAMPAHVELALDNGVKPAEISEIVTHLAFYSGWGHALAAATVVKPIFARRGIGADQLPQASPSLLPIDQASEDRREATVQGSVGPVSPGLVRDTREILFKTLWLRPDLAPRDRSLATVSSLVASGQVAQLTGHLNRALDNGLTKVEAGEVISHIASYAGWPNAFSAATAAKSVLDARPN